MKENEDRQTDNYFNSVSLFSGIISVEVCKQPVLAIKMQIFIMNIATKKLSAE